jgi:hypothetical protein
VFEGLLPTQRENTLLRTLLFNLATWHAFAKLRMHTDSTLNEFRAVTTSLGKSVRTFIREVCSLYNTNELPYEMAVLGRRDITLVKRSRKPGASQIGLKSMPKQLNLSTYKYHALGDYPNLIARHGTTDNASTQTVRVIIKHKLYSSRAELETGRITAQDDQTSLWAYQQKEIYSLTCGG